MIITINLIILICFKLGSTFLCVYLKLKVGRKKETSRNKIVHLGVLNGQL